MTYAAINRAAKAFRELRRTHAKLERASEAHERARAAFREAAGAIYGTNVMSAKIDLSTAPVALPKMTSIGRRHHDDEDEGNDA